jgi:histone acetyltransferase
LKSLNDHHNSWPFRKPVDIKKVPDYLSIIKEPMDFQKILKKLQDKIYKTKEDFKNDIIKIFDNARTFNAEDTVYHRYACQL